MNATLYFGYGANISRDHMARACPGSRCQGRAMLPGMRLIINEDGWATVVPSAGEAVHGALWMLTAACEAALDAQEDVDGGLYSKERMVVLDACGQPRDVTVYVATRSGTGMPNPGYLERIVTWAECWGFPEPYRDRLSGLRAPRGEGCPK